MDLHILSSLLYNNHSKISYFSPYKFLLKYAIISFGGDIMQWYHYALIFLTSFLIFVFIFSIIQAKKASIKLTPEQFKEHMRKGQLIDVRSKQEFDAGHINGARNINIQTIMRNYHSLRKDQPIYLYCSTGKRSSRAALFLRSKGYHEIYELDKGLRNWNGPLK